MAACIEDVSFHDACSLSKAVDPFDSGSSWNSVASAEAVAVAVPFPESVFENREEDLNELLHPLECLGSECWFEVTIVGLLEFVYMSTRWKLFDLDSELELLYILKKHQNKN